MHVLALDINECKLPSEMIAECFGECFNTIGSYQCLCPPGTIGNPLVKGGCVHYNFTTGQYTSLTFCGRTSWTRSSLINSCCRVVVIKYSLQFQIIVQFIHRNSKFSDFDQF